MTNNTGVAAGVSIILTVAGNAAIIWRASVAAFSSANITERFIVLQPGDLISLLTPLVGTVSSGFGAQLEGVAD